MVGRRCTLALRTSRSSSMAAMVLLLGFLLATLQITGLSSLSSLSPPLPLSLSLSRSLSLRSTYITYLGINGFFSMLQE